MQFYLENHVLGLDHCELRRGAQAIEVDPRPKVRNGSMLLKKDFLGVSRQPPAQAISASKIGGRTLSDSLISVRCFVRRSRACATANLRSLDMMTVDDLFIKVGYVQKFSDATYGTFFAEELNVNIDEEKSYAEGGSKGKRLHYFLRTVSNALAIKALKALWDQRGLSAVDHTKTMQAAAKRPLNQHEPRPNLVVPDCPPKLGPAAQRERRHATAIDSGAYL